MWFIPPLLHLQQCTSTKMSRILITFHYHSTFRLEHVVQPRHIPLPLNGDFDNLKNANMSLYISTLAILLGSLRVPFHLLQLNVRSVKCNHELNQYCKQIVLCLKRAEEFSVPQERVRRSTKKLIWSCDPEVRIVKNKAKLWLRIWIDNSRPQSGNVFEIKEKTKRVFKKRLRSSRYKRLDCPTNKNE